MRCSTWSSRMSAASAKCWTTCTPPILTSTKIMFKHSWTLLSVCRFQTFRACVTLSSSLALQQWRSRHFPFQACWAPSTTASWGAVFLMMLTSTVRLRPRGPASAVTWTTAKGCLFLCLIAARTVTRPAALRHLLKNSLSMATSCVTSTVSSTSNKVHFSLIVQRQIRAHVHWCWWRSSHVSLVSPREVATLLYVQETLFSQLLPAHLQQLCLL